MLQQLLQQLQLQQSQAQFRDRCTTDPATVTKQPHGQTDLATAALSQLQLHTCITDLPAAVIAHLGTFCNEAARRAASESHRCFAAIYQCIAEHTWVWKQNPLRKAQRLSDAGPSSGANIDCNEMVAKLEGLAALMQRKPRLQTVTLCIHGPPTTGAASALAVIACHMRLELRLPPGRERDFLAALNTPLQLMHCAYVAAAARAHSHSPASPPITPQDLSDWLQTLNVSRPPVSIWLRIAWSPSLGWQLQQSRCCTRCAHGRFHSMLPLESPYPIQRLIRSQWPQLTRTLPSGLRLQTASCQELT